MNWERIIGQAIGSALGGAVGMLLFVYFMEGWEGLKDFLRHLIRRWFPGG